MRIVLAVVLLLSLLTWGACSAQTLISDEVRARVVSDIDKIAASRQQRMDTSRTVNIGFPSGDSKDVDLISADPDLRSLMQGESSEYTAVVTEQLADPDPMKRGVACELLADTFDLVALQGLGALLDDTDPCIASRIDIPQAGPVTFNLVKSTVGETAGKAIRAMIGLRFPNKAWFDIWWKANKQCDSRLWYWAAKWKRGVWPEMIGSSPAIPLGVSKPDQSVVAADVNGRLSRLKPDAALRILLLVRNRSALDNEIMVSLGGTDKRTIWPEFFCEPWSGPDKQTLVDFVKKHKLKGRLIELLCQKDLYPEAQSESAYYSLVTQIGELGSSVFSAQDEQSVAQAQTVNKPYEAPIESLVLLRTSIAPTRAHAILHETLARDPSLDRVARSLAESAERNDQDILVESFKVGDPWRRSALAQRVKDSAGRAKGIDAAFVKRLVVLTPEPTSEDIAKYRYDAADCLCDLARAANKLAGRNLVTDEDIEAATISIGKRVPTDYDIAHNAAVPEACHALKSALLAVL
jgi:hypothetical protein